jgi:hypothetical protein
MSGTVVNVVPRTPYVFDTLVASSTFTIPIARFVDISQYREATVMLRVHARTVAQAATGAKITVSLIGEAPTSEDPANDFATAQLASYDIVASPTTIAPSLQLITVPGNSGGMITIRLGATQGTQAGNLSATISVDVSLKS